VDFCLGQADIHRVSGASRVKFLAWAGGFVDGMVEEITTAIARLPWLFVIARNSAFYKGKAIDVKQVARELGVRYVLEGSVRKAGNRVRITGQLIDTTTGAHIWAERFDGALDDIFELQDQVASTVAGAIEPKLRQSEMERARRKPTANLTAYDLYLRTLAQSYRYTEEGHAEAIVLARQALAIDPSYAPAAALVGSCRVRQRVQGWGALSAADIGEACRLARQALEAERDDADTIWRAAWTLFFLAGEAAWRRRLSTAPWRSTRTRLTPGWAGGLSTRSATSPRRRSKPSNGRAV
jgi:adenylate cyclase